MAGGLDTEVVRGSAVVALLLRLVQPPQGDAELQHRFQLAQAAASSPDTSG